MEIRQATESDSDRIREIAEQSFQASYALSPLDIEGIVEVEFEGDSLSSRLDDDGHLVLVAEGEKGIMGFSEGHVREDEIGEIRWLHVDPTNRGGGVGTELFKRVRADLRERTVEDIQTKVLAENQEGGEFFEQFDFESHDQTDREFAERELKVEIFRESGAATEAKNEREEEYTVPEDEEITVEGETRYLGTHEAISGDEGKLLFVFADADREEHFGFYCTNCGTFTDSVDRQGKVVCENCGNEHRPDEWDGSYL